MHPLPKSSSRRDFLKRSAALSSLAFLGGLTQCAGPETKEALSKFRFAMCNECFGDLPFDDQCRIIADTGYTGVEIAPFTLVKEGVEEIDTAGRQRLLRSMIDRDLECVGLHWLFAPPPEGLHFTTPDPFIRTRSVEYLRALIDFCADLRGSVLIFGSPKQRGTNGGASLEEAKEYLAEGLSQVADQAGERGVKVLVETLDSSQTDVVNTMAESLDIVERVSHPAIGTMFDYHNTLDESDSLETLVRRHFDQIDHIQIQEMDGRHLGTGDSATTFVDSFRALAELGYDKWISLEVFDFNPGGEAIATESMKVLQALEAAARA